MTDYAAMTDAELNRRVMERLGWKVEWRDDTERYDPDKDDGYPCPGYAVIAPYTIAPTWGYDTEEEAWQKEVEMLVDNTGSLLDDIIDDLQKNVRAEWSNVELYRAIALAWLAWKEGQG